jgi:hypothetical protein
VVQSIGFWFMTPCSLQCGHWHVGGTCCLYFPTHRSHWPGFGSISLPLPWVSVTTFLAVCCYNWANSSTYTFQHPNDGCTSCNLIYITDYEHFKMAANIESYVLWILKFYVVRNAVLDVFHNPPIHVLEVHICDSNISKTTVKNWIHHHTFRNH